MKILVTKHPTSTGSHLCTRIWYEVPNDICSLEGKMFKCRYYKYGSSFTSVTFSYRQTLSNLLEDIHSITEYNSEEEMMKDHFLDFL